MTMHEVLMWLKKQPLSKLKGVKIELEVHRKTAYIHFYGDDKFYGSHDFETDLPDGVYVLLAPVSRLAKFLRNFQDFLSGLRFISDQNGERVSIIIVPKGRLGKSVYQIFLWKVA